METRRKEMAIDLQKFETEMTPLIAKRFSDIEAFQQKCYRNNRERQLRDFCIGWDNSWSSAELLEVLRKKLASVRKARRHGYHAPGLFIMAPMYRAAYFVEVELAKEAA